MKKIKDLIEYYQSMGSWDDKINFIATLKSSSSKVFRVKEDEYLVGKLGRSRIIRIFRKDICEYNRLRKINEPVRNIFTGTFVEPGNPNYTKTLKYCGIRRLYSTCLETLIASEQNIVDPQSGKSVPARSRRGKAVIRRCR